MSLICPCHVPNMSLLCIMSPLFHHHSIPLSGEHGRHGVHMGASTHRRTRSRLAIPPSSVSPSRCRAVSSFTPPARTGISTRDCFLWPLPIGVVPVSGPGVRWCVRYVFLGVRWCTLVYVVFALLCVGVRCVFLGVRGCAGPRGWNLRSCSTSLKSRYDGVCVSRARNSSDGALII